MQAFHSSLPALYLPERPAEGELLELPEEEARHLKALRLHPGDPLLLLDGRGGRTRATVERIERRGAVLRAGTTVLDGEEGRPYIVLAIGQLADRSRFEWVVEKGVELGAREIVPLVTARSEGRFQADRAGRIAVAALKQSQRSFLPQITPPVPFAAMLERVGEFDRVFICHESAPIGDAMGRFLLSSPLYGRILILIGPEGGFTSDEVEAARDASALVVSLGESRLRAETAALAALVLAATVSEAHCRQDFSPDGTKTASATGT